MRHSTWLLLAVSLLCPPAVAAQTIQNVTLRRAQQAFDNLDYRQALSLGQASLRERLTGFERARAYELLGFTYSGMDSILKAVDAFKQVVLIEPERDLDPTRTSPKALSAFQVDRKSTRLNSSHVRISYAVFCLKKKPSPAGPRRTSRSTRLR